MNNNRKYKGKSIIDFPNNYIVLDLETTGLSPKYDEIIEISALKIANDEIVSEFSTLINPNYEIDEFITELTGITNKMLLDAPKFDSIANELIEFLQNETIVGHNVNFDINFLYDNLLELNHTLTNDFIDTLRISRKLNPNMKHHRLCDLIELYNIDVDRQHRALDDCKSTYLIYNKLKEIALDQCENLESFSNSFRSKSKQSYDYCRKISELSPNTYDFDETHPLYNKHCVFTGALEKLTRIEAAQLVINCGGTVENNITKKTNILILGNNDYCKSIKDAKSTKQKKAEQYIKQGEDLIIIPEDVFYSMIGFND